MIRTTPRQASRLGPLDNQGGEKVGGQAWAYLQYVEESMTKPTAIALDLKMELVLAGA
jgi:hypothetical protein